MKTMMKDTRRVWAALALWGLLGVTGAQAQTKILLGVAPAGEFIAAMVAREQGFFKKRGLDVDLQIVPPGLEWPVLMTMRAPAEPGRYVGEIDLVHEGISWFGDKGSPTLRFSIDVTAAGTVQTSASAAMKEDPIPEYPDAAVPRPAARPSATPTKADFPMNGVPREQVMEIIRSHGGRLAYLEEDRRAGPEWVSYRYFVASRS